MSIKPRRAFYTSSYGEFNRGGKFITAVSAFPNRRWILGASRYSKLLYVLNTSNGDLLKKMEGHRAVVVAVTVSPDGKLIASGDEDGDLIAWDGDTGEALTQPIKAHSQKILSLEFSPDSAMLVSASWDKTIKLWRTDTWDVQEIPIDITPDEQISCVRYSPSGELLAIASFRNIQIWDPSTLEWVAKAVDDDKPERFSRAFAQVAWTPDGTRLYSAGDHYDRTIREWDTSTWKVIWSSRFHGYMTFPRRNYGSHALTINPTGTLLACIFDDGNFDVWRLSDFRSMFNDDGCYTTSVTFSPDEKYMFTGGKNVISEWLLPVDAFLANIPKEQASYDTLLKNAREEQGKNNTRESHSKILSMNTRVHNACVTSDLSVAQELLTQQTNVSEHNYNSYANRSFVYSRKRDWDNALHDALKSVSIHPSLIGYISKGLALCGKMEFNEAAKAFDLAFMFTDEDSDTFLLLLVKAIALFNANQQEEAMLRVQKLRAACPKADTLACRVVEAYFRIQLGIEALNDARHSEATDHFTAAIDAGVLSCGQVIHSKYEVFVVLFGWDLLSSWRTANQSRCDVLLRAGKLVEAQKAYRYMMDMCNEATKTSCLDWSTAFTKECNALCIESGDVAFATGAYDRAIELYSAAIDLDPATDTAFAKRCKAKLGKMLWEEALDDAQKITELNPSSYLGYHLKQTAFCGAQRYDEAIGALDIMLLKLDDSHDPEMQALRRQYSSPSDAQGSIRTVIDIQTEDTPPRLLDTSTGRICGREAQINAFKTGPYYTELLLSPMKEDVRMQRIKDDVVTFFRYVTLSHRWQGEEVLLHEIQDKDIYELDPVGNVVKLQSFCRTARDAGYRWAWIDTCCIDQNNNVEVQRSVNSMFTWYHHSALTIIYLSDVPPASESGAMARSAWNTRGWTVQEFLAAKIILFYQNDWTLYLDDRSSNHKESAGIMRELEDATGINRSALTVFRPGMGGAREKLQWASMRVTTLPEDVAYSLFGIFGVHLPVIYGEKKQNALGRLLQQIIAQSSDITCLDWVGKSSEFNSCLPASITSHAAPLSILPLSENEMQTSVASLRHVVDADLASKLYNRLSDLGSPVFVTRRLRMPCIVFTVTDVTPMPGEERETCATYAVKADGLHDFLITTEDRLSPFSSTMLIRKKLLVVRPWDHSLLELYDSAEPFGVDSESDLQALQLIVRLGQPFRALLLAQQWGREYNRIAADHSIIAQVKDMASVCDVVDVKTVEIL